LGRHASVAELGDGLALEHGRLPLALVTRALRRVEVEARVMPLALEALAPSLLPALLLMKDGSTAVLVAWREPEAAAEAAAPADSADSADSARSAQPGRSGDCADVARSTGAAAVGAPTASEAVVLLPESGGGSERLTHAALAA